MPQVWRSRPWGPKGKQRRAQTTAPARPNVPKYCARAEALTKQIADLAKKKQLSKAIETFKQFHHEDLEPTVYTFSSLINAHVRSGDLDGAVKVVRKMKLLDIQPNVSIYTILLKGHSQAGNTLQARAVLEDMLAQGVAPDVRAINTLLRGCLNTGDVLLAHEVFIKMESEWHIVPDSTSHRYVAQLLSQGLRLTDIKQLVKSVQSASAAPKTTRPKGVQACKFWASGNCSKGANCKFFHDPSVIQANEEQMAQERRASEAAMNLSLAHAAAMLGRWTLCNRALRRAESHTSDCDAEKCAAEQGLFQKFGREEMQREMERIATFAKEESVPDLLGHLSRTFLFSVDQSDADEKVKTANLEGLVVQCVDALSRSFGLDEVLLQSGISREEISARFQRCLTRAGHLRPKRIFGLQGCSGKRKREDEMDEALKPLKLELCSGNGDWVVAQAKAEQGEANWMALELKHDRVHSIFSRMVFEQVENLCVIRGDASKVVPNHIKEGSIAHIFINFPEPPHFSGHSEAEAKNELLTSEFFKDVHAVLGIGGRITLFSDNHRYSRTLAKAVAEALGSDGERLFATAALHAKKKSDVSWEEVCGIRLYCGTPGKRSGHAKNTESFFDRFWRNGQHVDRYYFVVERC